MNKRKEVISRGQFLRRIAYGSAGLTLALIPGATNPFLEPILRHEVSPRVSELLGEIKLFENAGCFSFQATVGGDVWSSSVFGWPGAHICANYESMIQKAQEEFVTDVLREMLIRTYKRIH